VAQTAAHHDIYDISSSTVFSFSIIALTSSSVGMGSVLCGEGLDARFVISICGGGGRVHV
jgi:hypothetical protein